MTKDLDFGRVSIIGDLLLDRYISGRVRRISPEAPVPVLLHENSHAAAGGAANVAVNAAALGCDVQLIGLVGEDGAATQLRGVLQNWPNIRADWLISTADWPTITKTRVLSGRQQIVRIDEERLVPLSLSLEDRLIEAACQAISCSDVLVCSDYAKGVLSERVLQAVIEEGRRKNIPVIIDPKRASFAAYKGASLVTPNRQELEAVTGPVNWADDVAIARAAHKASAQFGGAVLVTRSEEGMTLWQADDEADGSQYPGRIAHASTHKSEVYDVSGAGDTVVATIAAALSAGQELETAMTMATIAASIAVSKLGTATVSRQELADSLLRNMAACSVSMSLEHAVSVVQDWRRHGARIVFTNGCFDLLHPGHVSLIHKAACEGDRLIVGINSDYSVKRLKGESRPVQDQQARAMVIGALKGVDMVVIFEEDTPLRVIETIKPDILVKGADYKEDEVVGGTFVKSYGGRVALVDLVAERSTTALLRKANRL